MAIRGRDAITWLEASGPPVGFFADSVYEARAVQLNPADLIVAYTDGIVEATNATSDKLGMEGLLAAVTRCQMGQPDSIVQAVFAALDEFSGDNQTDDATMVAALAN
jgi:sigma-B regulation protein RsbU (phosphoserine phosphatase)